MTHRLILCLALLTLLGCSTYQAKKAKAEAKPITDEACAGKCLETHKACYADCAGGHGAIVKMDCQKRCDTDLSACRASCR